MLKRYAAALAALVLLGGCQPKERGDTDFYSIMRNDLPYRIEFHGIGSVPVPLEPGQEYKQSQRDDYTDARCLTLLVSKIVRTDTQALLTEGVDYKLDKTDPSPRCGVERKKNEFVVFIEPAK